MSEEACITRSNLFGFKEKGQGGDTLPFFAGLQRPLLVAMSGLALLTKEVSEELRTRNLEDLRKRVNEAIELLAHFDSKFLRWA